MQAGRAAAALLAAAAAAGAAGAPRGGPIEARLRAALQGVLDARPLIPGQALQLGWKSADMEFALAAGEYNQTGPDGAYPRKATAQDTFLFGSASKTFTAAAVMRLVDRGVVNLTDPVSRHVDPVIRAMRPLSACPSCPASWDALLPGNGSKVTVEMLLNMRSGIKDYDDFDSFDGRVLRGGAVPLDFIDYAAQRPAPFLFEPGTSGYYSSTNFVIAGLVLAAHDPRRSAADWVEMRTGSFYPDAVQSDDLSHSHFFTDEPMRQYLTGPGRDSNAPMGTGAVVYNQSSSALGYTCANYVGRALDAARWFWDLAGPAPRVVSPASLAAMRSFRRMSFGQMGSFQYGLGLMQMGTPGVAGSAVGHGGFVYGFNSNNGVVAGINASLSIVSNAAGVGHGLGEADDTFCPAILAAAGVLGIGGEAPRCTGNATKVVPYPTTCRVTKWPTQGSWKATCAAGVFAQRFYTTSDCSGEGRPYGGHADLPTGQCLCQGTGRLQITCATAGNDTVALHSTWENPHIICPMGGGLAHVC